jgi:hypothetical protein
VRAVAVGLLLEEQRGDVTAAWRGLVERELGGEPVMEFAVGPILREMALALRGDAPPSRARSGDGRERCAVLVRSGAQPSRVAREFKLLHRALWDVLRAAGRIVGADERRAVDEWLDEALATALERIERVRMRIDLLEHGPAIVPARPTASPSLAAQSRARPPPLPRVRPPPLPQPMSAGMSAGMGAGE